MCAGNCEKMKKNQKNLKLDWTKRVLGCILFVLFVEICTLSAAEASSVSAEVQLADPELETQLAENREQLAKLKDELVRRKAELEKLKTEDIRIRTENAQKTAEAEKLALELKWMRAEFAALKDEISMLRQDLSFEKAGNRSSAVEIAKLKNELADERAGQNEERRILEEQNSYLRKELLDTVERCAKMSDRLSRMEKSAAGVLETLEMLYVGQRESDLADALDLAMQSGMRLVSRSSNICEMLLPKLDKLGLAPVDEARLRVILEELAEENRLFARLNSPPAPPESLDKCRVLEVADGTDAVILNAGHRDGVRVNMVLYVPGQKDTVLKVVAVRPFVSAAVPEQGSLNDLSAGMELRTGNGMKRTESDGK